MLTRKNSTGGGLVTLIVSTWSVDDVQQFLVDNGLNVFNPTFLEHEICGETLATITDSDIRNSLGITILDQRRRLLAAVARHAQEAVATSASTPLCGDRTPPYSGQPRTPPAAQSAAADLRAQPLTPPAPSAPSARQSAPASNHGAGGGPHLAGCLRLATLF